MKNIGKNISKNLSGKYSQKILDHARQSATDTLQTVSKSAIQRRAKPVNKILLIKSQKSQELHRKILQTIMT